MKKNLLALLLGLCLLTGACSCGRASKHPGSSDTEDLCEELQPTSAQPIAPVSSTAVTAPEEPAPTEAEPSAETQSPPETEPSDPALSRARELLSQMTLYEKLCQLIVLSPDTVTGVSPTTAADESSRAALAQYPVCGFSFSQENLQSRDQVSNMLSGFQSFSKLGLLFCLDEEGGTVWRVMGNSQLGTTRFDSMYSYKDGGVQTAFDNAQTIAQDVAALGFNVDFAPVADIWNNPANTVIGKRAYSDQAEEAALLIPAAVEGFHAGGVACTLKHFPGHGSTAEDSHKGLAIVHRTAAQLREEELLPFKAGIDAGADLVMVGHLLVSDIDPEVPATFSEAIVTELLREELGFDGVVITDSLGMGALAEYSEATRCLMALDAGCDILLGITQPGPTLSALQAAVADGTLTEARVDESVLRILQMKIGRGIIPLLP